MISSIKDEEYIHVLTFIYLVQNVRYYKNIRKTKKKILRLKLRNKQTAHITFDEPSEQFYILDNNIKFLLQIETNVSRSLHQSHF